VSYNTVFVYSFDTVLTQLNFVNCYTVFVCSCWTCYELSLLSFVYMIVILYLLHHFRDMLCTEWGYAEVVERGQFPRVLFMVSPPTRELPNSSFKEVRGQLLRSVLEGSLVVLGFSIPTGSMRFVFVCVLVEVQLGCDMLSGIFNPIVVFCITGFYLQVFWGYIGWCCSQRYKKWPKNQLAHQPCPQA